MPVSGSKAFRRFRRRWGSRRSTTFPRRLTISRVPAMPRGSSSLGWWSDFSLMDAIESGIVKVPRIPVDDDAAGDLVTYLRLWDHIGPRLPKKKTHTVRQQLTAGGWVPPEALEGADAEPVSELRKVLRSLGGRTGGPR